jgi:signal transduction histidine kinase
MPIERLSHLLQTWAFCLVIASLQAYLRPDTPYELPLVYSLAIGTCTWALIDLGRIRIDPGSLHGWPRGWRGLALPAASIPLGFIAGIAFGDGWFGRSSWHSRDPQELMRSMLITLLASIVISYFFYSRGRSAGLVRSNREARRESAEARLKLLEAQLEPHMLFNTLANLRVLIATDAPRAETMLDHLVAYLRATLDGARAAWHPLADEFARLDDYLALMAVRMGDRLTYRLQLPDALRYAPLPPLLLQPLVENAIRHGLEPQLGGGSIDVCASVHQGCLQIEIRDTGLGLRGGLDRPGFGTAQVHERLATAWGDGAEVRFEDIAPHGTRVVLRWPLAPAP